MSKAKPMSQCNDGGKCGAEVIVILVRAEGDIL